MSNDRDIFRVFPFELLIPSARIRWSCPLACGWSYDENPHALPAQVLLPRTPAQCTPEELNTAFIASAARSNSARFGALETLFSEHLELDHPEVSVQDLIDQRARKNVEDRLQAYRSSTEREATLAKAAAEPPSEAEIRRLWFGEWKDRGDEGR